MKYPVIDSRATGVNLRKIMDDRDITVKDLKEFLGLSSIQSIYHWLNGICLPSIDNLYAMSIYFGLPMDVLICGSGDGCACGYIDGACDYGTHRNHAVCTHRSNLPGAYRSGTYGAACCRFRFARQLLVLWEYFGHDSRPDRIEIIMAAAG